MLDKNKECLEDIIKDILKPIKPINNIKYQIKNKQEIYVSTAQNKTNNNTLLEKIKNKEKLTKEDIYTCQGLKKNKIQDTK